ncbi:MAG: GTP cyclohydrolase II, partial [Gammaproteobacteria bacterium]|nr:GTP cyclohydrolase II [Gammaproteobacteria bacterium]
RRHNERLVERMGEATVPTEFGSFTCVAYKSTIDNIEHLAFVKGDVTGDAPILVRVHSECLTGDVFGSKRCDCGPQLAAAMQQIDAEGRGVVVYLRGHEGRGIGIAHKIRAYSLQDQGFDTVDANTELGLPVDSREYGIGAQILADLGIRELRLMTNNPAKYGGIAGYGLSIVERVSLSILETPENASYLRTKRDRRALQLHGNVGEIDERRAHGDVAMARERRGHRSAQALHQPRVGVATAVHLPVAGDERLAHAHPSTARTTSAIELASVSASR